MKLTPAQRWALKEIKEYPGVSPAFLGQRMMERPGVEERRRGGNRNSPQGLGRIAGTMIARLKKMGLVKASGWPTQATITQAGIEALKNDG